MPSLRQTTLLAVLASLTAAAFFVLLGGEKYILVAFARLTAPRVTPTPAQTGENQELVFDFVDKEARGNLAIDSRFDAAVPSEGFFQRDSPHLLKLSHLTEASVSLQSFGIFVEYQNGQFTWLKIQIAASLVTYPEALRHLQQYLATMRLSDRIRVAEYDAHLGPVEDSETWVPIARLPHATFWPMLNCNWERMIDASSQLKNVACRPTLNFSPPE